jgi:hypothetical protein
LKVLIQIASIAGVDRTWAPSTKLTPDTVMTGRGMTSKTFTPSTLTLAMGVRKGRMAFYLRVVRQLGQRSRLTRGNRSID